MLTRDDFTRRFGRNAIIGMVHVGALPGAPLHGGSMRAVIDAALRDARALRDGGCDAMAFENFGDRPFFKDGVPAETVAALTRVIVEVVAEVALPFGVNVLRNDAASAMAVAAATGAAFIRVNIHTGAMLTDQGIIEGRAAETLRKRVALAPEVLIFADHMVKHAVPLVSVDEIQAAKDLRHRGFADGIIISGVETGAEPDRRRFASVREALADVPILIGSGLTVANASTFASADGAIVGTSIKIDGRVDAPVDPDRVARLVAAFKGAV
ncbi:MAG TPA: BtpA/SgcQ family protein [Thermoanaerobaculia bacterium]|jgi:membrane complex biogenesis BtpA family protein|nr:BtpA/SgcQ family protein [Thermoanaerobaculia bacterium]